MLESGGIYMGLEEGKAEMGGGVNPGQGKKGRRLHTNRKISRRYLCRGVEKIFAFFKAYHINSCSCSVTLANNDQLTQ
jgi:hypothetical protein